MFYDKSDIFENNGSDIPDPDMGPVPWQIMKCCNGPIMGINHVYRPQDTLCEVHAEIEV